MAPTSTPGSLPPSADAPHPAEPATTSPPGTASILHAEALAWRRLTHSLGVELRRRLIPLVRARLLPLDIACRVLESADLPPLSRRWSAQLTMAVTTRGRYPNADEATGALHRDLDRIVRQALGSATTVVYPDPPHALATAHPSDDDETGDTLYQLRGPAVVTAQVRADSCQQARSRMTALVRDVVAALPGVEANLGSVDIEPDEYNPVELTVDTDAPYQEFIPPPSGGGGQHITEARTMRWLAREAWQYRVRQIRAGLITVLLDGELGEPGRPGSYGLVDDLLRDLGLPGLPRAHLYEITARIRLTVAADNPAAARLAAYRTIRDAAPNFPQCGLPITHCDRHIAPDIAADNAGAYQVTWPKIYLVCLHATHSPLLAEQTVRLQLGVLADALPDIADVPLTTVYLGEYIDHRLEADRD